MCYKIWNSYKDFTEIPDQINELFPDFSDQSQYESKLESIWSPLVDIYEENDSVILTADMPGVEKENVHVQVDQNKLVIFGVRTIENENSERYHRIELTYGKFMRTFNLLCEVDQENIEAKLNDGILTIILPKTALLSKTAKKN